MAMKLIMENWRKYTESVDLNEVSPTSLTRITSLGHSGTQLGMEQTSLVSEILEIIAVEIALIYETGTLPKILGGSGQLIAPSWTGQDKKLPGVGRRIMNGFKSLPGWKAKLQSIFSNPRTRRWVFKNMVKSISNHAGRLIPWGVVAYTLIEIGQTWRDEGQGIDIWDATSFGFDHAVSKGDAIAYGGEGPTFKPGEETGLISKFDEWPEEMKMKFCKKNLDHNKCKLYVPDPTPRFSKTPE